MCKRPFFLCDVISKSIDTFFCEFLTFLSATRREKESNEGLKERSWCSEYRKCCKNSLIFIGLSTINAFPSISKPFISLATQTNNQSFDNHLILYIHTFNCMLSSISFRLCFSLLQRATSCSQSWCNLRAGACFLKTSSVRLMPTFCCKSNSKLSLLSNLRKLSYIRYQNPI